MTASSYQVSENLFLVRQTIGKTTKKAAKPAAPPPTNHIAVIDCSGSMYYDLPKIREQLKNRIPKLLKKDDTLTIIWFSGRGQFGTLIEAEPVASLTELQDVHHAIDRYLRTVGLTGFKEPIEEAERVIGRISKKNNNPFALFFMSDGCDNQWNRQQILKAVEQTAAGLSSATFVEYGYYADRPLLTAMAEKSGGQLIFSQDFNTYAPLFETAMTKKVSGAPKIEVAINGDPINGFAFSIDEDELTAYAIDGGKIAAPEDLSAIFYVSPAAVGKVEAEIEALAKVGASTPQKADPILDAAYAAVSLYATRMKPDIVYPLLKALGDVQFIEQFGGCFGKQKYSAFMDSAKEAAFGKGRFEAGFDPTKVPDDNAFTVLHFLKVLASDDDNRLLLDSSDFSYNKIGRSTVDASENFSKDEEGRIDDLKVKIANTKDAKEMKALSDELAEITANKGKALKFDSAKQKDGYPVNKLTFNQSRPNVSVLVRREGTVDISDRVKGSGHEKVLPKTIPSYIHRNYAIIKDGLVNVDRLPVRMTAGTVRQLKAEGFPEAAIEGLDGEDRDKAVTRVKKASNTRPVSFVVDLGKLPVINRAMVQEASAKRLFELEFDLAKAKAAQKVFNTIRKEKFEKTSEGFKQKFGDDAAAWLKEQGITDYNGFNPKRVQAPAVDFYMAKELKVSLKGLSTLPSLKDVEKRVASGKLTPSAALMAPYVEEVTEFLAKNKAGDSGFEAWIVAQQNKWVQEARRLMYEIAQIKFSVIVGQTWFTEFKSLDENTMDLDVGADKPLACKVEMAEVEQKI